LIKLTIEKPAKITEFKYGIQIETKNRIAKQKIKTEIRNKTANRGRRSLPDGLKQPT
jgi:hypothetical protein